MPCQLDIHKSMAPEGIHPRLLRELVKELPNSLSITYQKSWLTGEVPADWKLANVMPFCRKGQKDDLGNCRPVSLTSVPDKFMEEIILSDAFTWDMQDNQGFKSSQCELMKGRSCLTNLISLSETLSRWEKGCAYSLRRVQ